MSALQTTPMVNLLSCPCCKSGSGWQARTERACVLDGRSVDIVHIASGTLTVFPCNRWINRWCGWERVLWADAHMTERMLRHHRRRGHIGH